MGLGANMADPRACPCEGVGQAGLRALTPGIAIPRRSTTPAPSDRRDIGDLLLRQTLNFQQDDLRPPTVAHRHRPGANPPPQLRSLLRPQLDPWTSVLKLNSTDHGRTPQQETFVYEFAASTVSLAFATHTLALA
jgi:hypothetical protein